MNRIVILVSALCLVSLPTVAAVERTQAVRDIDRIVAIVNNDVITETELADRLEETRKQLAGERIKAPPEDVLKRQLLERMIVERVQLQLAAQLGVRVSDADVDQAINTVARRNNMSADALLQALARDGLDPAAYRARIRDQVTIQQLLEREIASRITVTESEIANFLEQSRARGGSGDEYNVSHIFVPIPEAATSEQIQAAKARAEKVHAEIKAGEDFARAAVTYSQSPDALKGGALDWKKPGQLPELFVSALKNLKPGDISPVLRGPNGFHILKLNDRRGDNATQTVIQTHVRHILLRPSEIQSLDEARAKLLALRERIEAGEDFAAIARATSEDSASASQGGDLGWVEPKSLVPEFEQAMNALSPRQLSEPVRTPFGLHLIQVLERREQAVGDERARNAARSQIHARKADDRYEQWLRQLRDEAYVEYLLDDTP
ncbi:MAG: peptidylprolyl isomerase [Gammaproteobacteria bacterium]